MQRLVAAVTSNINDLKKMLEYNLDMYFFRIGSEMVPFASHAKFRDSFDWVKHFQDEFNCIGDFVKVFSSGLDSHLPSNTE